MDHEKIYLIKQLINFILTVLNKKDKRNIAYVSFSKYHKQQTIL